ncbi:uncharacterized protein LOC122255794 [Penaeus japonicus]|uniref:uncharacterized protein LOC122255794 n=1 Tax=Penaeus japonicus TaxID=27405 RepID=UPI001C71631C|nr:uncharacterized protein LOC122255794 [Penaeus japonicus]
MSRHDSKSRHGREYNHNFPRSPVRKRPPDYAETRFFVNDLNPALSAFCSASQETSRGFRRREGDLTRCERRRGSVLARRPYRTLVASLAVARLHERILDHARLTTPARRGSLSAGSVKDKSKMCSMKSIIICGILLAVFDILQGMTTLAWYGYRFVWYYFYLCPRDLPIDECHAEKYHYEQMYILRTYIGIGEGAVTPIFAIIFIFALLRHKPWLAWCWLIKAVGVLGINVYFLSQWLIRQKNFEHFRTVRPEYDYYFLWIGIGLTLAEVIILILFCLIGAIFTYMVCEERRRSRRSLHRIHKMGRHGHATAPPLDGYDDESSIVRANIEEQFFNHGLHNSTNKLPLPGSTSSMDEVGQASTLRAPTQV